MWPWLITPPSTISASKPFDPPVSVTATSTSTIVARAFTGSLTNSRGLQATSYVLMNAFTSQASSFVGAEEILTPYCQACTVYNNIPMQPASSAPTGSDVLTLVTIPTSKPSAPTFTTTGSMESVVFGSCTVQDFFPTSPTSKPFVPTFAARSVESVASVLSNSGDPRNVRSDGGPTSTVTSTSTALMVVGSQEETSNTFTLGEQSDFEQLLANFSFNSTKDASSAASSPAAEVIVRNPIPSGMCEAPEIAELPVCAPFLLGPLRCVFDGTCSTATDVGFVREHVPPSSRLNVSSVYSLLVLISYFLRFQLQINQDSHSDSDSEEALVFVYTIASRDVLIGLFLLVVAVSFVCFEIAVNKLNHSLKIEKGKQILLVWGG